MYHSQFLTAPSCSELHISPDPSPSISPESSLYTTGVHHRSDYAAWTLSSTDAATSHLKTPLRRRDIPDSLGPWLQWRYVSPESLALPVTSLLYLSCIAGCLALFDIQYFSQPVYILILW